MSKQRFSDILANDAGLKANQAKRKEIAAAIEATAAKIANIQSRIDAAGTADVRNMADAILTSGPQFDLVPVTALRDELEQLKLHQRALESATTKLDRLIESCISGLCRNYVPTCADDQRRRAQRIVDGFLSIAEADAEERRFLAEQEADGCAAARFPAIRFAHTGQTFGTWPSEAASVAALIDYYTKKIEYKPTAEQARRLATLSA